MLKFNFSRNTWFIAYLLIFNLGILSLLAGLVAVHTLTSKNVETPISSSKGAQQIDEDILSNVEIRTYPSLNGQKVLVLYRNASRPARGICNFVVQDARKYVLLSSLPDSKTIQCVDAFPFESQEVIGWSGDRYLLFKPGEGDVIAYDFMKEVWKNVAVDATTQEWLARGNLVSEKSPEGKILISQGEGQIDAYNLFSGVLEKSLSLDTEKLEFFYDATNQGYLLMGRKFSSFENKHTAQTNIYFMPVQTLIPRLIASTQPFEVVGRGCAGGFIQGSETEKIFFQTGGCYKLNEKESELFEIDLRAGTFQAVVVNE